MAISLDISSMMDISNGYIRYDPMDISNAQCAGMAENRNKFLISVFFVLGMSNANVTKTTLNISFRKVLATWNKYFGNYGPKTHNFGH